MQSLPEPHPLDYDWRFSQETVHSIVNLLRPFDSVLAVGTPTVARMMDSLDHEVLLVDRQPFQGVRNQQTLEPSASARLDEKFSAAIIDPPWYPSEMRAWLSWTADFVDDGGVIFVSLWPPETRPTASDETKEILTWIRQWSTISEESYPLSYDIPSFEKEALRCTKQITLSRSPRRGKLLRIIKHSDVILVKGRQNREHWVRFVLNDYQIALRVETSINDGVLVSPHWHACDWKWPFVSRRAPDRSRIDLWSSRNEVGIVSSWHDLLSLLRRAIATSEAGEFNRVLGECPALLSWQIPRPPYWRSFEWHHLQ